MKRKLLISILVSIIALGMSACTQKSNEGESLNNNNISIEQSQDNTSQDNSSNVIHNNEEISTNQQSTSNTNNNNEDNEKIMSDIKANAINGVDTYCSNVKLGDNISDVEQIYGQASESNYVPEEKGVYYNYKDKNLAFGCNKGEQIFEIRSYDDKLKQLSLNDIEKYFGNPDYQNKTSVGEKVVGYVASNQYKLLFVFDNDKLDHYSVLYPEITANYMADDPGREW